MNRIGPRASKSRGSDSEYVHAYHDYNVIDRHPGTSQIHLLTYLLTHTPLIALVIPFVHIGVFDRGMSYLLSSSILLLMLLSVNGLFVWMPLV